MNLRRVVGGIGHTLIAAGVLILLFVAYELWGTGIAEARSQHTLKKDFKAAPGVDQSQVPPPTPEGEAVAIIKIPRLGLEKAVVEGVGVEDLKKGPGHYPGTPLPGQPGNAFKLETAPIAGEAVIEKRVNSAFIGTSLETDLRRAGCRGLVIVGLTTNHCVSTTARMAGNLGFVTWVVSDATATFDRVGPDGLEHRAEQIHAIALSDLHGEFATIVDTAAVVAALLVPSSSRSTP